MENKIVSTKQINLFKNFLINGEKAEATIQKYLHDINFFVKYIGDSEIDKTVILKYKTLLSEKYSTRSANSMIAALNTFLKFLGCDNLCIKQFKIQKDAYCSEDNELTKAEYIALVDTAEKRKNQKLSLLVQTICATGIRVSELQSITVEAVKKGEAVVSCKGKTRKIFIVKLLKNKLLRYAKEYGITSGMIFITRNGKPMNRSNIWRQMKNLCVDAGVLPNKVFPHNLRHLFARTFYGIEKDIAKLADILGHSNINTTRIYIMTTCAEHKNRMEKMRLII